MAKYIQLPYHLSNGQRVKLFRRAGALAIATMGTVNELAAVLPIRHDGFAFLITILYQLAPFTLPINPFNSTRSTIALIVGFFLTSSAIGIAKGKRHVWQLVIVLLPLSVLVHLAKGRDIVYALLILLLWYCFARGESYFHVASDSTLRRRGFALLVLGFSFLISYGWAGLSGLRYRLLLSGRFGSPLDSFLHTFLHVPNGHMLSLTISMKGLSLILSWLSAITLLAGIVAFLSPVGTYRRIAHQREYIEHLQQRAKELVGYYGRQTLAFFTLASENFCYLTAREDGLVSYRLAGNVAVVLGNPICSPKVFERVTRNFLSLCETYGWCPAFFQARAEHIPTFRALGLQAFKIGEEAMLELQTFSLSGSAMANARTSARRAEREGVQIEWYEGTLSPAVIERMSILSHAWLGDKAGKNAKEMGFSMGRLNELSAIALRADQVAKVLQHKGIPQKEIPLFVVGIATNQTGQVCAFVTFTPIYGERTLLGNGSYQRQHWGWGLDLVRRVSDAPPGVTELLLVRAIERFRERGAQVLSLGMVALADTLQEMTHNQRQVTSFLSERLPMLGNHRSLFQFKQKFRPRWESRYLVTATTLDLLRASLVLLHIVSQQ